jgi:DNA repair protein RadA
LTGFKVETGIRKAEKLDTGSSIFNSLLGGGLATCAITDLFGAAATGKTQFAFQSALLCSLEHPANDGKPSTIFVDCAGSFRPERIIEMAEARKISHPSKILDQISSIKVRSVKEQHEASEMVLNSSVFYKCKLLIVDDATTNFAAEYAKDDQRDDVFVSRYYQLASYARKLAYIALSKNIAVLLTNSVRSRLSDANHAEDQKEVETMGDIISQFALFRLHFTKRESARQAKIVQPNVRVDTGNFEIKTVGIIP